MDEIDSGPSAKTPPIPRRRPLLFFVMVLLSISLVGGTFLLSNDMRHLRQVLKATGQEWVLEALKRTSASAGAAPKGPRLVGPAAREIAINPRLWKQPEPNLATALRRQWQMSGPDMCKTLRKAGAAMSDWQPAAVGTNLFECSYDKTYAQEGERVTSSLFLIIRGDAKGRISSMRAKLVDPPRGADGKLDPALAALFETMLTQSKWEDFEEQLDAIRSLKDIRKDGFGASMSFTREVGDAQSYNFLLSLTAKTAEQRRLNDLFRVDNGFDLQQPPPLPTPPLPGPAEEPQPMPMAMPPAPAPEPQPVPNRMADQPSEPVIMQRTRPLLPDQGNDLQKGASRLQIPHGPSER